MEKHLDYDQKAKILVLNAQKRGLSSISKMLKIPKQTIHSFLNAMKKRGTIYNNHIANNPQSIAQRTERRLLRLAIQNRRATSRQLKEMLELDCDPRTIRNALKKHGFQSRRPRKKPALSAE